jgi:hypothetical protein
MHQWARLLRPLFWAEAALNLLTGTFAFFLPPLFLAALTSQPGTPVILLFIQGYGVLLGELACMEGGALLFKQDVVLRFVLCCLLVGDFLHSGALVIFVLASGRHWTGSVVSALVITAVLVCLRLVWLMRSEMAASQHPASTSHDEKRL